jgi:hypothetical protein
LASNSIRRGRIACLCQSVNNAEVRADKTSTSISTVEMPDYSSCMSFEFDTRTTLECTAPLDEFLPADELLFDNIVALLEICARIVSWLFNEQMVLKHLLGNESW